ncbi:MAG: flagellar hook protein FlgE [Deltaproteobacteria bacterium]|nr:flagellar hook protein FlgE [Deltaproteobacteria bacterium]
MSVSSAFYTGLSGLDTSGTAMGVLGDNVANISTTGYKSSSIFFSDVLGLSLTGVMGGNRVGAGAKTQAVDVNYTQGTFKTTGSGSDVAINGNGMFVVRDSKTGAEYYTRDGHLTIDNEGYYVNSQGYRLQGYKYGVDTTTGTLALEETLVDIQVTANGINPPLATSDVTMVLNLNASDEIKTWAMPPGPANFNYSAPVTIYDSLGAAHVVQVYFTKTAASTWSWNAVIDGSEITGGTPGTPVIYGSGGASLTFDPNTGALDPASAGPVAFYGGALTFANGATPTATNIDFTGSVSYDSPSTTQDITQNGYPSGSAISVGIDELGNIVASYSNGTVKPLYRMALADFKSLSGLERKGMTIYQATIASGDPLYNKPGEGGTGKVNSTMLEEANVDLATELIKMIIVQRAYQANAKVISMADEMMQAVQNIR